MTTYIRDGRAPIPRSESISKLMRSNKAKNTTPEILLRRALWGEGIRGYRLHPKRLPGRPDITFSKYKVAVFINGCFWHRCPNCDLPLPRSNTKFWQDKFDANISRDLRKINALIEIGWNPITIWECDLQSDLLRPIRLIRQALGEHV